jgi:ribosomal protein L17
MVDRLTSDNGKPRVFRDSLVSNLADFLQVFDVRNLGNDEDLAKLAERCRELMAGVAPKDLRTDTALRAEVQRGFSEVKARAAWFTESAVRYRQPCAGYTIVRSSGRTGDQANALAADPAGHSL